MRTITTQSNYWQTDCWNAAENGEPFYLENLQPMEIFFLKGLQQKFHLPARWGPEDKTFLCNPVLWARLEQTRL